MALPDIFEPTSYLLRKERRFRFRDKTGALDGTALALAEKLLPTAAGIAKREQLLTIVRRLKAALGAGGPALYSGIPVAIEYPAGATRTGTAPDGTEWSQVMTYSYGFLPDTIGMDGDELDVFLGPEEESPVAFAVVCGTAPPPGNWELKLMLGWLRAEDAQKAFCENVPAEYFDGIYEVPVDLVRNLLRVEVVETGGLKKSLTTLAKDDGGFAAIADGSVMLARVVKRVAKTSAPPADVRAAVEAGAVNAAVLAAFDGYMKDGGAWLQKAVAEHRCKAALDSATLYAGDAVPIDQAPELADHPSRTAPLSGTYEDPFAVGGWLGWIEPATGEEMGWIAFVGIDGRTLLWTQREESGGVIGTPYVFFREDLATSTSSYAKALVTVLAKKRSVPLLPIAKDAASAPPGMRLIHGIVLEPEPNGGAGDAHEETYSQEIVTNAAHGYLLWHQNMTDVHGRFFSKAEAAPVESFLAPVDYTHNGTLVRKGAWVVVTKVFDDGLWERVLAGELNAYSIGGYAERRANL